MSKLVKLLAAVALVIGAIAVAPGSAEARYGGHRGGWHGGWHGGWGPAWGYPYAYYPQPYYYVPACGWVRVRVWRNGHWVVRRVRQC